MFLKTSKPAGSRWTNKSWRLPAVAAALAVIWLTGAASSHADEPSFDKPLFSDKLFGDEDMGTALDNDVTRPAQPQQPSGGGSRVGQQISNAQVDSEFIRQLRSCARWLQLYGVRNGSRFPGLTNDEGYAAQVQLNELCPNNPYNAGYSDNMYNGTAAWLNSGGTSAAGSPVWADQWTEHLQAAANNRIILSMDFGLTPDLVNQYAQHPPQEWSGEAPGTINCIGNGQGLFIVWGAGRDGRPVRNPANGLAYISAGSTSGLTNDQIAPNEGGIP